MSEPWYYSDGISNCCGAAMYNGICSRCKEHCEAEDEELEIDIEENENDT